LAQAILFIYDKYEDMIDHHVLKASGEVQMHYNKFDVVVLSKIPRAFKRRRDFKTLWKSVFTGFQC
jgi:hypothetical protein